MKFTIKRINGEVAFEADAETLAQAMILAVNSGADLRGAYLCGAYLCGANLRGADGIISLGPCDGWWVYAVRHADGPRFAVGCQWFTLAEARAYWAGKENRAQVLRAVEWLATEAAARGWEAPKLDGGGE